MTEYDASKHLKDNFCWALSTNNVDPAFKSSLNSGHAGHRSYSIPDFFAETINLRRESDWSMLYPFSSHSLFLSLSFSYLTLRFCHHRHSWLWCISVLFATSTLIPAAGVLIRVKSLQRDSQCFFLDYTLLSISYNFLYNSFLLVLCYPSSGFLPTDLSIVFTRKRQGQYVCLRLQSSSSSLRKKRNVRWRRSSLEREEKAKEAEEHLPSLFFLLWLPFLLSLDSHTRDVIRQKEDKTREAEYEKQKERGQEVREGRVMLDSPLLSDPPTSAQALNRKSSLLSSVQESMLDMGSWHSPCPRV